MLDQTMPQNAGPPKESEITADESGKGDGSYEICIRVYSDGKLAVGVESGGAEEQGESNYKPAESIKDALTKALEIYKADGKGEAADDAFNAGFSGMGQ